jgi:hypothetical protein
MIVSMIIMDNGTRQIWWASLTSIRATISGSADQHAALIKALISDIPT